MGSELYRVIASFTDGDGMPLSGPSYSVALLDQDRYFDDKLGESRLNSEGRAEFMVAAADILSFDSAGERTPDIYFVLRKDGDEVFRSEVFTEVDFDAKDPVTGRAKGLTKAFGPFSVAA